MTTGNLLQTIRDIVEEVKLGKLPALSAYIRLKETDNLLKLALEEIKEEAIDESSKYPEKSFEYLNAKVTLKNDAGRWKFDHIREWQKQKTELSKVEDLAKQAFKLNGSGVVVDSEGEVVEPAIFNEGKLNISVQIIDNEVTEKLPFD